MHVRDILGALARGHHRCGHDRYPGLAGAFDEWRGKMKTHLNHAQAAVLIGLCLAVVSGVAHAENNTASHNAALRKACAQQDGRFEQSWIYNDQGVQWGQVVSCATNAGYVRCQDNHCRSGRWILRDGTTASKVDPGNTGAIKQFAAEPTAFSDALAALSKK